MRLPRLRAAAAELSALREQLGGLRQVVEDDAKVYTIVGPRRVHIVLGD